MHSHYSLSDEQAQAISSQIFTPFEVKEQIFEYFLLSAFHVEEKKFSVTDLVLIISKINNPMHYDTCAQIIAKALPPHSRQFDLVKRKLLELMLGDNDAETLDLLKSKPAILHALLRVEIQFYMQESSGFVKTHVQPFVNQLKELSEKYAESVYNKKALPDEMLQDLQIIWQDFFLKIVSIKINSGSLLNSLPPIILYNVYLILNIIEEKSKKNIDAGSRIVNFKRLSMVNERMSSLPAIVSEYLFSYAWYELCMKYHKSCDPMTEFVFNKLINLCLIDGMRFIISPFSLRSTNHPSAPWIEKLQQSAVDHVLSDPISPLSTKSSAYSQIKSETFVWSDLLNQHVSAIRKHKPEMVFLPYELTSLDGYFDDLEAIRRNALHLLAMEGNFPASPDTRYTSDLFEAIRNADVNQVDSILQQNPSFIWTQKHDCGHGNNSFLFIFAIDCYVQAVKKLIHANKMPTVPEKERQIKNQYWQINKIILNHILKEAPHLLLEVIFPYVAELYSAALSGGKDSSAIFQAKFAKFMDSSCPTVRIRPKPLEREMLHMVYLILFYLSQHEVFENKLEEEYYFLYTKIMAAKYWYDALHFNPSQSGVQIKKEKAIEEACTQDLNFVLFCFKESLDKMPSLRMNIKDSLSLLENDEHEMENKIKLVNKIFEQLCLYPLHQSDRESVENDSGDASKIQYNDHDQAEKEKENLKKGKTKVHSSPIKFIPPVKARHKSMVVDYESHSDTSKTSPMRKSATETKEIHPKIASDSKLKSQTKKFQMPSFLRFLNSASKDKSETSAPNHKPGNN